jgi:hypothetical protein
MGFSVLEHKYVYMIKLFNEEVNITSTNSVHNTLYVESFEEVFFGVYEFELNSITVIAEEVAKYRGNPVVTIPVVNGSNKYNAPFILRKGAHRVKFNAVNTVFVDKVIKKLDLNTLNSTYNTLYVESFEEIFFGIYEFELNGDTVIAERVATYKGDPVVTIPVSTDGNKYKAPFILKEGVQKVKFNTANTVFIEKVIEESDLNVDLDLTAQRQVVKLFNEEVDITLTNSVHNTLYVKSFKEVFSGVYEFELNGDTVIAEKLASYESDPVIAIPVVAGGNKYEAPFILRKGKPKIEFNELNTVFIEKVIEESDLNVVIDLTAQRQVVKLFNEEVDITSTNSVHNTLYVESFKEGFFGIYEFELNGDTVIAEKIATYEGDPVVTIPVITDGNKYEAPFILRKGKPKIEFNELNTVFIEKVIEESDLNTDIKTVFGEQGTEELDRNVINTVFVDNVITELDLNTDLQMVKLFTEDVPTTLTNSVHNTLYVESFEEVFFGVYEFKLNGVNVVAEEVAKYEGDPVVAIPIVVDGNKYEAPFILKEGVQKVKFNVVNTVFIDQITEEPEINTAIEAVKQNICDNNISTNAYDVDKSGIVKDINKALSRVGSVKKELEDSKRDIAKTIMLAEERIRKHYDVKMREIEKASVNTIRKSQILEAVKDSKVRILAELNNSQGLKKQLRDIAEEASNGLYDPVSSKRFQDQIKKDLTHSFSTEMQQIKRMVSSYGGGGGSNAVQYARGGTMHGNLNIEGNILSGGVDLATLFDSDTVGEVTGTGTAGNLTRWDSISSVTDSVISESAGVVSINGDTTISGNLSVLGDFTYINTLVSVTSALSVINHGAGPAIYIEQTGANQPIATFIDSGGSQIVFNDGGKVGIGTGDPDEALTVSGNISASGTVRGTNIDTLTNNVSAIYSYLIQNFETNTITIATSISDFVSNYPKTGLVTGDVLTISATNTSYILGDNDGSALSDWLEVNLKPNFLFYKQGLADYGVLDTIALSSVRSTKYIVEVSDKSDDAIFYGEVNVVSDGTIAVATEYGLNHTTLFPFVEFGAEVLNGTHIQLSAIALEGKNMSNFVFKGNRSNLFG